MVPGFGFDVEPSVFVKMIYTRSGGLCAAENKISFDIASILFLPTQMGWLSLMLLVSFYTSSLFFNLTWTDPFFPLFCYVA